MIKTNLKINNFLISKIIFNLINILQENHEIQINF